MARHIRCPNCGGGHDLANPGIQMLVCDYCQTTIYWDAEGAAHMGSRSVLPEGDTRLFLGAAGRLGKTTFRVVGQVRYRHQSGSWDEWYLELGDGKFTWISEDERRLTREREVKPGAPLPPAHSLSVGAAVAIKGIRFTVREAAQAQCAGAQGQLPFAVLPEETYPYLDLASDDGRYFATLEYDEAEQPHLFVGSPISHEQLQVDTPRPEAERDLSAAAQEVSCPNCGAPLEQPQGREVQTLVCAYCGSQNDLSGAAARVMGINPEQKPDFLLEIGAAGTLSGISYEVCGRMEYTDAEGYRSREYLLWNPERGYLWLAEERGHFLLMRPTRQAPRTSPAALRTARPKTPVLVGKQQFLFYETSRERLTYVDGALPWLASVGDQFTVSALIRPPQLFELEADGEEIEYFVGEYLPPEQVWQAFGLKPPVGQPAGVHPAQPRRDSPTASAVATIFLVLALVNLLLAAYSWVSDEREIFTFSPGPDCYTQDVTSELFSVGPENIMKAVARAPVKNGWVYAQLALVDEQGRVQAETACEVAYYFGRDVDGRWTEGSQRSEVYFRAPPAGAYRLIVKADRGDNPSGSEKLKIALYQGGMLIRYFLALAILLALYPSFVFYRRRLFETRRWADVMEDDDDD